MTPWELAAAIIVPVAAVAAIILAGYFYFLPKILVGKIRSGEDNVKFPENYDEICEKITTERDLVYKSRFPENTFDFYRPKNGVNKGVVVWVHGGFFIAGDKKGVENVCASIAAEGFCVAAINYVAAPEFKYPAAVVQLNEAVGHILAEYPEETAKGVYIAGDSAGGQIAAQFCALACSTDLQTKMKIEPLIDGQLIKGAALVCAPIDVAELRNAHKLLDRLLPIFGRAYFGRGKWYKYKEYQSSKFYEYIEENFPPTFITDGNNISFENQNKKLAEILDAAGVRNETLFFGRESGIVNHEYLFDLSTEPAPSALKSLIAFFDESAKS